MPMFVPLEDLNYSYPEKLKLIKYGEQKTGKYGPYYPDAQVERNGVIQGWNLKVDKYNEMISLGVKPMGYFWIEKVKIKTTGHNFISIKPDGDISVQPQNLPKQTEKSLEWHPPASESENAPKPINAMGRGQCFGIAAQYVLKYGKLNTINPIEFISEVAKTAELFVETQEKFINKK